MPVYCYETEKGERIEVNRLMQDRDKPLDGKNLKRVVPDRFAFNGVDWKPRGTPKTQKQEIYDACKIAEERGELGLVKYSKRQLDKIWADEN